VQDNVDHSPPSGADPESGPATLDRPLVGKGFIRTLFLLTFVLAAVSLALAYLAPDVPYFFSVDGEMGVWAFLSVVIFMLAAAVHAIAGRLARPHDRGLALAFATTALILTAFAFDDFSALHERLGDIGDAMGAALPTQLKYAWVLPGLVVAAVCIYIFWILMRRLSGPPRRDLLVGLAIFFAAALGVETVNGLLLAAVGPDGWQLRLGTHLEEILENVGVIFILRAAARTVAVTGDARLLLRFAPETTVANAGRGRRTADEGSQLPQVPDRTPAG
jgi:hypothetical protein